MANNHFGDVEHGKKIIDEFSRIQKMFCNNFCFYFKFQLRDLDTFIHKDYKNRIDLKYVKRFQETNLKKEEFIILNDYAREKGFLTMATTFDESSVDLFKEIKYDTIKIASCSFTDWPLLNKICDNTDVPIIASTGGASMDEIRNVVTFFKNRKKNISILHCIGEYPTQVNHYQMGQIDLFKKEFPDIHIGWSSHENPEETLSAHIVIAKDVDIIEKHVGVESDKYKLNAYSLTPEQMRIWLIHAITTMMVCGIDHERCPISEKEQKDLLQFKRGVFTKSNIKKGDVIDRKNVYYAWPNIPNQILANDMSKYVHFIAETDINEDSPVLSTDVKKIETRKEVWDAVQKVKKLLHESGVTIPNGVKLELSHHYGIERFNETGISMLTVFNEEYCKKLIVVLSGQSHPPQRHNIKKETFTVLHGSLQLHVSENSIFLNKDVILKRGDSFTITPGMWHAFTTSEGCVIEELSGHHDSKDSYYLDEDISTNKNRKTIVDYWL